MIVQCQACQTKFKVPDEKFGDKPVKVRCSKCQNVFGVKRLPDGTAEPVAAAPKAPPPPEPPAPPPPAAAPEPPADPFASFGPPPELPAHEKTTRGVWHAGIAATRPQRPSADPEVTRPGVQLSAVLASRGRAQANVAAPDGADPFGGPPPGLDLALDALTAPPPAAPPPLPLPSAAPTPAFEDPFGDLDLAGAAPAPPSANAFASPAPSAAPSGDPFGGLDLAATAPPLETASDFSFEQPGAAPPAATEHGFFDLPSAEPSPPLPTAAPPGAADDEPTHGHAEPDRSFFDLPSAPATAATEAEAEAPAAPRAAPSAEAPRPRMALRPRATPQGERAPPPGKPLGQRVLGALLNGLFVVAVAWGSLLTYASARADWHFDPALLRPTELVRAVFGAKTAAAQLVLEDLASGRYALRDGKEVFFVRGQVVNRGKSVLGPARAHVELLEGDRVLAQTDAWAGAGLTPEQVYNLGDAAQLLALQQQQQQQARPLSAGEGRPFVALLLEPPADLSRAALRVTSDLGPRAP